MRVFITDNVIKQTEQSVFDSISVLSH